MPRASKKVEEIARPNTLPYAWKVLSMFFMKLFVNKMPQQASKTTRECPRAKNLGHSNGAKPKPADSVLRTTSTPYDQDQPESIPTVCGLLFLTVSFRVMLSIAALQDTMTRRTLTENHWEGEEHL